GQPYPPTTNVLLYASFKINFVTLPSGPGTNDYFAHFYSSATTFRDKIYATTNGAAAGSYRVGIANVTNWPSVVINTDLSTSTDYRLVTRYAPSNGVSTLWVNPTAESDPSVTATDAVTTTSITA